jgi:hypothetical protein
MKKKFSSSFSLSFKHLHTSFTTVVAAVIILAGFQGSIYLALLIPKYPMMFDGSSNDETMQN